MSPGGFDTWSAFDGAYYYLLCKKTCPNNQVFYDTVTVNVDIGVGIKKNLNNFQISLYPNPSNDLLNIECKNKNAEIKIIDVFGNTVKQQNTASNNTTIHVSDLKEGFYFIQINAINATITKKLIVQH